MRGINTPTPGLTRSAAVAREPVGPRMPSDIDYARTHRSAMCTFSPPGELNVHGALTAASELSV